MCKVLKKTINYNKGGQLSNCVILREKEWKHFGTNSGKAAGVLWKNLP